MFESCLCQFDGCAAQMVKSRASFSRMVREFSDIAENEGVTTMYRKIV